MAGSTFAAGFATIDRAAQPSAPIPANVSERRASLSGKPSRRKRTPPPSTAPEASGLSAVRPFRQSIRQAVTPEANAATIDRAATIGKPSASPAPIPASRGDRVPRPASGLSVYPANIEHAAPDSPRQSIRRPFDRGEHRPRRKRPACQRQAVTPEANAATIGKPSAVRPWRPLAGSVRACQRFDRSTVANAGTPRRRKCPRRIPANARRFSPPCAQPLAVRLAIAATVRFSPAYFAPKTPLQAVRADSGKRPPPSNAAPPVSLSGEHRTRRHHRQAVTPEANAATIGKPSAVRPWRPLAGSVRACQRFDRSTVANAGTPRRRKCPRRIPANARRFSPPCAQPLAVRLAIAATVRFSPAYFAPKTPLQAVRADSGQCQRTPSQSIRRPFDRGEHRTRRAGFRQAVRQSIRRPCAASRFRPVSGSTAPPVRHHRRKRGVNARRCVRPRRTDSRPSRRAAPLQACFKPSESVRQSRADFGKPSDSLSGEHRNAATIGSGQPFDRVPPVSPPPSNTPPEAGDRAPPVSGNRSRRLRPMSANAAPPDSGKPSASLSGDRSTVATVCRVPRPACQRFGSCHHRKRRPLAGSSPRRHHRPRRNRPPLRPPAPDGFAPVPPCRALARPFNAA